LPTSWGRSFTRLRICAGWKNASCRFSPCRTGSVGSGKRPSAKAEGKPREDFIVTIDRSDDSTAFVKVRCQLPPSLTSPTIWWRLKLGDGWQIVSKSYRYDLRE